MDVPVYHEPLPVVTERLREVQQGLDEMGQIAETAFTALPIDFDQMRQIREQAVQGVTQPMPVMP